METSEIYSNIPMRTWRWLGVNEIKQPEGIEAAGELPRQQIVVEPGQSDEVVLEHREGGAHETVVHVGKGAKLHLVLAELAPSDTPYTNRVKVQVDEDGAFSYTGAEVGGQTTADYDMSADSIDATNKTSDGWGETYAGNKSTELSLEGIVCKSDEAYEQLQAAFMAGEAVDICRFRGDGRAELKDAMRLLFPHELRVEAAAMLIEDRHMMRLRIGFHFRSERRAFRFRTRLFHACLHQRTSSTMASWSA